MANLVKWNNIRNNFIYPGQKLIVGQKSTGTKQHRQQITTTIAVVIITMAQQRQPLKPTRSKLVIQYGGFHNNQESQWLNWFV